MAAEGDIIRFTYSGGGRDAVPQDATHVSIDESVTVIPKFLFSNHPNIVELICHDGVEAIEAYAFRYCSRLRRVVIPGVELIGYGAFENCSVTHIECPKVETILDEAFQECPLRSIDLPSAKIVQTAFGECGLKEVNFGKNLENIETGAFDCCCSLERITIPLKNGLFLDLENNDGTHNDNIFYGCYYLERVDLVEGDILQDTINALLLEDWKYDMNIAIDSINHILPNASAGEYRHDEECDDPGEKAIAIREWIELVLEKIIDYKAKHRQFLNEAASALQLVLPNDIVNNDVVSFLELPLHKFDGEGSVVMDYSVGVERDDDSDDESADASEDEVLGEDDDSDDESADASVYGEDDEEQQQQQDNEVDDGSKKSCYDPFRFDTDSASEDEDGEEDDDIAAIEDVERKRLLCKKYLELTDSLSCDGEEQHQQQQDDGGGGRKRRKTANDDEESEGM